MIIKIKRIVSNDTLLAGEIAYQHSKRTLKVGDAYPLAPPLDLQAHDYWNSAITITGTYRLLHLCIYRATIDMCDAIVTMPFTSMTTKYTFYSGTMTEKTLTLSGTTLTHDDSSIRRIEIYKEK